MDAVVLFDSTENKNRNPAILPSSFGCVCRRVKTIQSAETVSAEGMRWGRGGSFVLYTGKIETLEPRGSSCLAQLLTCV